MATIYELFGFPVDDRTPEAETHRQACLCPFMGKICDGGGNRSQTKIDLKKPKNQGLRNYFNSDIEKVIPGVCSIKTGKDIWVVCPRRLLVAKFDGPNIPLLQPYERDLLLQVGLPPNTDIGVWAEVRLQYQVEDADIIYRFDYILAPLVDISLRDLLKQRDFDGYTQKDLDYLIKTAKKSGYFRGKRSSDSEKPDIIIRLPDLSHFWILEIMTASTSGSNTKNETDIRSAFGKAVLNENHEIAGINKRQVWGRMVTQLFAKTALSHKWNGQTIWVIQDALLNNIELTTGLNTNQIPNNPQQNIRLMIMHYSNGSNGQQEITFKSSIQGDSGIDFDGNNTFSDILLPKLYPPKMELLKAILKKNLSPILSL